MTGEAPPARGWRGPLTSIGGPAMSSRIIARNRLTAALALAASLAAAPAMAESSYFQPRALYGGPRVWLGNLNGAVAFGAQVERGFTDPGKVGSEIGRAHV